MRERERYGMHREGMERVDREKEEVGRRKNVLRGVKEWKKWVKNGIERGGKGRESHETKMGERGKEDVEMRARRGTVEGEWIKNGIQRGKEEVENRMGHE